MRYQLHWSDMRSVAVFAPLSMCVAWLMPPATGQTPQNDPLKLVQTITLKAQGRLGSMIVDRLNDRVFVAASDNGTVEVVDLKTGKTIASIANPGNAADFVYYKKCDCVAYSMSSGVLRILNPNTLTVDADFSLAANADAVGLDPQHGLVYVAQGRVTAREFSQISIIDLMAHKNLGVIQVEGGSLGQMALEHHGSRGFINNTATNQVMVIELSERKIVERWNLSGTAENVSLALDEKDHRLFVGSRKPETVIVVDTQTGATVANLPTAIHVADIAYDATLRRLYLSGGDGLLDVIQQNNLNSYKKIATIVTSIGAGSSRWVPEQRRLYVAGSPQSGSGNGRILVYEASDSTDTETMK